MSPKVRIVYVLAAGLIVQFQNRAATNLLPGIEFFPGKEALSGKLSFALSSYTGTNLPSTTNYEIAATVYDVELPSGALREVHQSPLGTFIRASSEKTFAVVHCSTNWGWADLAMTNIFVYSDELKIVRRIAVEKKPTQTIIVGGHVFFEVGTTNGSRLLNYDIREGTLRQVELPSATKWRWQKYERLHVPPGQANVLHFFYEGFGALVSQATDYPKGYYALDLQTMVVSSLPGDNDDSYLDLKAYDGRFVGFEGRDAPVHGVRLVLSRTRFWESNPTATQTVETLTTFPNLGALSGDYALERLSADRRFALVKQTERGIGSLVYAYHVVDLANGSRRELLRYQGPKAGSISELWWVHGP